MRPWAKKRKELVGEYKAKYGFDRNVANLPPLVKDCLDYLEADPEGTTAEGIFRISGDYTLILSICSKYELLAKKSCKKRKRRKKQKNVKKEQVGVDLKKLTNSVHVVAGVLKKYLRDLPIPLLTFELYDCFIAICSIKDDSHWKETIKTVINLLPAGNKALLVRLLKYIKQIAENEKDTKMTSANLAIVFAPGLLRPEGNFSLVEQLQEGSDATRLVMSMIDNYDYIFLTETNTEENRQRLLKAKRDNNAFYSTLKKGTIRLAAAMIEEQANVDSDSDDDIGDEDSSSNDIIDSNHENNNPTNEAPAHPPPAHPPTRSVTPQKSPPKIMDVGFFKASPQQQHTPHPQQQQQPPSRPPGRPLPFSRGPVGSLPPAGRGAFIRPPPPASRSPRLPPAKQPPTANNSLPNPNNNNNNNNNNSVPPPARRVGQRSSSFTTPGRPLSASTPFIPAKPRINGPNPPNAQDSPSAPKLLGINKQVRSSPCITDFIKKEEEEEEDTEWVSKLAGGNLKDVENYISSKGYVDPSAQLDLDVSGLDSGILENKLSEL